MLTFRKVQLVSAAPLFKTFHGILTVSEGAFLPGLPWGTCLRAPFLRNDAASAQCPEHSQDEVSAFLPSFCLNNSFSGEAVPDLGVVPSRGFGLFVPRHAREAACLPWGRDRRPPRLIPVGPGPWREAPPAHGVPSSDWLALPLQGCLPIFARFILHNSEDIIHIVISLALCSFAYHCFCTIGANIYPVKEVR